VVRYAPEQPSAMLAATQPGEVTSHENWHMN
jgi:hypothetical protein